MVIHKRSEIERSQGCQYGVRRVEPQGSGIRERYCSAIRGKEVELLKCDGGKSGRGCRTLDG